MVYQYPYNYSNGTIANTIGSLFHWTSVITNGAMGIGITVILYLITFGSLLAFGARKAMATAGFITFIFSVYLYKMGLINPVVPFTLIIITIIGAIGSSQDKGL